MLEKARGYLNGSKPHPWDEKSRTLEADLEHETEAAVRQYASKQRDKTISEMVEEAERTRDFYLSATRQANDLYQSYTAQHASILAMLETNLVQIEQLKHEYTKMYQAMLQRPLHTDNPPTTEQPVHKQVKKLSDEAEHGSDT